MTFKEVDRDPDVPPGARVKAGQLRIGELSVDPLTINGRSALPPLIRCKANTRVTSVTLAILRSRRSRIHCHYLADSTLSDSR